MFFQDGPRHLRRQAADDMLTWACALWADRLSKVGRFQLTGAEAVASGSFVLATLFGRR